MIRTIHTTKCLPRLTAAILAVLLTLLLPLSAANIPTYTDVAQKDWFYSSVYNVCQTGLMIGTSDTTFSPKAYITTAECVTLLARMHGYVTNSSAVLQSAPETTPWYQKYINYCNAHGLLTADMQMLISEFVTAPMSRAQIIALFSTLPSSVWKEINTVEAGAIPDVPVGASYEEQIYRAYRCGITIGIDAAGHFNPDQPITRAAAAELFYHLSQTHGDK